MEKKFGLIGPDCQSFVFKTILTKNSFQNGLRDYHYDLTPLNSIDDLQKLLSDNPDLVGLNVTIPYKATGDQRYLQ